MYLLLLALIDSLLADDHSTLFSSHCWC